VTIPVENLRAAGFDDEVGKLDRAVADHVEGTSSNVAVVADPFAGRDALLDYAEELLQGAAERVSIDSLVDTDGGVPELPDVAALIVDDCHYLFRRTIGGFDVLDDFLERMAMSDTLFITSWNRYAWRYLSAVRDVGDSFPVEIRIEPLTAEQIAAVVDTHFDDPAPRFVAADDVGRIKTVEVARREVSLGSRALSVPVPTPNPAYLTTWFDDDGIDDVVFEKIRRVSHGNPGIATELWADSVADGEISPGEVEDPIGTLEVADDDTAFLLWLVVANEAVARDALATVLGDVPVDKELQRFVTQGVLTVDGGDVSLEPVGLHPAVQALKRRRLVW
jgi:hypothetical protein